MTKAYWIARMDVRDAENYPKYIAAAKPAFEKFGARFLVRGGKSNAIEGEGRSRNVLIEFASYQQAVDCYNSPDYQEAVKIRQQVADGEIVIVEGL